ncbi:MAG: hypothetical protein EOP49_49900 [Sphingobacteriales bacterium]|nr:MAG: hypothetical protein EOP49_49900 [Sphingobacteriales bacterium]
MGLFLGDMVMKSSFLIDETVNAEFFSLASQLYVRLRRHTGRVIDTVYMAQNEQYAREILTFAASQADAELSSLTTRLNLLLASVGLDIPVLNDTVVLPVEQPAAVAPVARNQAALEAEHKEEAAQHYIGALR